MELKMENKRHFFLIPFVFPLITLLLVITSPVRSQTTSGPSTGGNRLSDYSNLFELSLFSIGGNSDLELYRAETKHRWKFTHLNFNLGGHYQFGSGKNDVESMRNWDVNTQLAHVFSPSLDAVVGYKIEEDEFRGLESRHNMEAGLIHKILDRGETRFFIGTSYIYIIENKTAGHPRDRYHNLRLSLDGLYKFSENFTGGMLVEYIPRLSDSRGDYLLGFEPSVFLSMNDFFSMKIGYKSTYDKRTPIPGIDRYDYTYTTTLIAHF